MRVAVPREAAAGEGRVALVPESVGRLAPVGFEIVVERGAGAVAGFPDQDYADAGARLSEPGTLLEGVEAIVRVARPSADEIATIEPGTVLIGFLAPLTDTEGIERLRRQGVVAFAMESVPRITRAQSMDALSSQATVAGYKAVLIAADRVQKMFPLLMTAAGTVAPAKVLVMGAGVAGLQAIATARRLGAVVSAFDVRPAVKEQVESLGARFLELGDPRRGDRGRLRDGADIRATGRTAGRARGASPRLRHRDHDRPRARGVPLRGSSPPRPSVRCGPEPASSISPPRPAATASSPTRARRSFATASRSSASRICPSLMAADASRLYARNVSALLQHLAPGGELALDFDDDITGGACVTRPTEEVAA